MLTASRVADGIEFVFKWVGLLMMLGIILAIAAMDPPGALRPASEFAAPAAAGAR